MTLKLLVSAPFMIIAAAAFVVVAACVLICLLINGLVFSKT